MSHVTPARVARIDKTRTLCLTTDGGLAEARVPKRLRGALAVGDDVLLEGGQVREALPRRTVLSRRAAGDADVEQVLAANVDLVLVCTSLDADHSPARVARYQALAAQGGARAVTLLTKADLAPGRVEDGLRVSVRTGEGMDALRALLAPGVTAVLVGSSGVGKSSLVNALLGEDRMRVQPVRADDDKGRHTTTHRELVPLPGGAWLIDSPGLREVQLWADADAVASAYADVADLAAACRFSDCRHETEPGCAVRDAVPPERLRAWRKLQAEARHVERTDAEDRTRGRAFGRATRRVMDAKRATRDEW